MIVDPALGGLPRVEHPKAAVLNSLTSLTPSGDIATQSMSSLTA
jgi:hypothetical protein